MGDVVALIVFLGCILVFLVLLFWYGLKGEQNQDPAIGTNRPYPDGTRADRSGRGAPALSPDLHGQRGGDVPPQRRSTPDPDVSPPHSRLEAGWMSPVRSRPRVSSMRSPPSTEPAVAPVVPQRRHRRKKHR